MKETYVAYESGVRSRNFEQLHELQPGESPAFLFDFVRDDAEYVAGFVLFLSDGEQLFERVVGEPLHCG